MHWTKGYLGGWWTEGRSHHAMTASLGSNATVEGDDDANNCTTIENYPSSRPHRSPIFFFLTTTIALALLTLLAGLRATSLGILPSLSASSRSSSKLLETMHTIGGSQDLPAPALLTDVEKEFEKETPQQYAIVEESHDSWPLTKAKVGDEKFVELQRISVPNSDTYNNTSEGDDEFDNMQEEEEDKSDSEKDGEKRHSDGKGTGDGKMEPHDFVALAQGSLLDRLTTLCLAPALAAALVHALNRPPPLMDPSPLPPPSSPHASWTEFSPLISPFNLSLLWLVSGQGSDPLPGHLFRGFPQVDRTVHLPACNSTAINERLSASQSALLSSQLASERLTVTVLAPAHTLPLLQVWSSNEVCAMHYGLHQCFASLQLSSSVLHLVESELHASPHLQDSTAIYLPSHSSRCSGCAGNLLNCTVREVAWKFLGEPMQPGALALLIDRNGSYVDGRDSKVAFGVATLAMVSSEGKGERGAEEGMDVNGRSHEHSQQQQQQQQRWQQRQGREDGPLIVVASESPRDSLTIQQSFHEGRVPHVMNVTAQQLQRCKQAGRIDCWRLQVAELYLLSMTRGIIMKQSKAIYCHVQKAACTSWKLLLILLQQMRAFVEQKKQEGVSLSYLHSLPLSTALQEAQVNISYLMRVVHNRHFSGLKYLDLDYKEHEIVRLLTRPDYFKFSFVRHPLARLLAVFLHIHVRGEDSHPRSHWNRLFFANSTEYQEALAANNGNETFPFDEFTRLLRVTFGKYETKMDRHVLPQSNLCVLSRIRYDFVGRLENSVHDVGYILSRILTPDERSSSLFLNLVTTAFGVGHAVHSTGAIRHLDMFDEESFQNAMAVYSRDLDIPTNDIHYEVPKILLPYMKIIDNIQ